MSRWTLTDPKTSESWSMPINPDSMTSPHPAKNLTFASGIRRGLHRARTFMSAPGAVEWTWEGAIRTQAHHDALEQWSEKGEVHVTDHLGRTWRVIMQEFEPTDRSPTRNTSWRLRYKMTVLNLGRIA